MIAKELKVGQHYWFINHKNLYPRDEDVFEGLLLEVGDNGLVVCSRTYDKKTFFLSRLCVFDSNPILPDTVMTVPKIDIPVFEDESKSIVFGDIELLVEFPKLISDLKIGDKVLISNSATPKALRNCWVQVINIFVSRLLIDPIFKGEEDDYIYVNFSHVKKYVRVNPTYPS